MPPMPLRLLVWIVALAAAGCTDSSPDTPPPVPPSSPGVSVADSAGRASSPDAPPPEVRPPDAPGVPDESAPAESPAEPPSSPAPSPSPAAPESPAPPRTPPAPSRTEAANAFWSSFQGAIRAGDRDAIEAGLAEVVTVGEVEYRRDSPQVQSVLDQIVENEQVRDAYLDAGRLRHSPTESTFSSRVRLETPEGDTTEAVLSGAVREVAPGSWRLVRLRTE